MCSKELVGVYQSIFLLEDYENRFTLHLLSYSYIRIFLYTVSMLSIFYTLEERNCKTLPQCLMPSPLAQRWQELKIVVDKCLKENLRADSCLESQFLFFN